jgi:putative phage-type endonuclease
MTDLLKRSIAKYGKPPTIGHAVPLFHAQLDDGANWLPARRYTVGGSEAAAAMGIGAHQTARQLGRRKLGLDPPFAGNFHTRRGHALEVFALEEFKREMSIGYERVPWVLQHPERRRQTCNLDGLMEDGAIGECKAPGDYVAKDLKRLIAGLDVAPMSEVGNYVIQCNHNMSVAGLDHAWLIVLPGTLDPVFIRLDRDDALIASIVEHQARFWDIIDANRVPPARGADLKDLAREWKRINQGELETADAMLAGLFADLDVFRSAMKEAKDIASAHEDSAKDIEATIVARAQRYDADKLRVNGARKGLVTHVQPKDKLDRAALEAAHPDIVKQFLKPSEPYYKVT